MSTFILATCLFTNHVDGVENGFLRHRENEISCTKIHQPTQTEACCFNTMAFVTYLKTTCIIQGCNLCATLINVRFDRKCQFLGACFDRLNGIVIVCGC